MFARLLCVVVVGSLAQGVEEGDGLLQINAGADESLRLAQVAKLRSTMKRASDLATIDRKELEVAAKLMPDLAGEYTKWFADTGLAGWAISFLTKEDILDSAMLSLKGVSVSADADTGNLETTIAGNEVHVKDALCALSAYTDGKATSVRRLCRLARTTSYLANNKCSGPESFCSLADLMDVQSTARADACAKATLVTQEAVVSQADALQTKMDSMVKLLEEDASMHLEAALLAAEGGKQIKQTCSSSFWMEIANFLEDYGKKETEVSAGL